jgi:hypothetical protein
MELSQYNEGIAITLQDFVQHHQCDQFYNIFIYLL